MVTKERTVPGPRLVPESFYMLDGERLKYLGKGMSGHHWFSRGEGQGLRAHQVDEPLVRFLLDSGQLTAVE